MESSVSFTGSNKNPTIIKIILFVSKFDINNIRRYILLFIYLYYRTRSNLSTDTMCRKCSTLWSDAQFTISINPIKCRQKSKINRLNKNLEKKKKETFGESLRIPIKKMKRLCNNIAVST